MRLWRYVLEDTRGHHLPRQLHDRHARLASPRVVQHAGHQVAGLTKTGRRLGQSKGGPHRRRAPRFARSRFEALVTVIGYSFSTSSCRRANSPPEWKPGPSRWVPATTRRVLQLLVRGDRILLLLIPVLMGRVAKPPTAALEPIQHIRRRHPRLSLRRGIATITTSASQQTA